MDNEDGMFDRSTDTLADTVVTDSGGAYLFTDLPAGVYFVVQPRQAVNGRQLFEQASDPITIEELSLPFDAFDDLTGPVTDTLADETPVEEVFNAQVIGGQRDLQVNLTADTGSELFVELGTANGALFHTSDLAAAGTSTVTWDGIDLPGEFNPVGLGNIDLTEVRGVAGRGVGICLNDVLVDTPGATLRMKLYTDATNWSEAQISDFDGTLQSFFLPFDNQGLNGFRSMGSSGGVDFTNLGAARLEIEGTLATNASVGQIFVVGADRAEADFVNQAEPSIDIEKLSNGFDADTPDAADVPNIIVGSPVSWTYSITNTGTTDLFNVIVTDDQLGQITNRISPADSTDIVLNPGEVWVYEATANAIAGPYSNLGSVLASAPQLISEVVADEDLSHYVGVAPSIDVEKLTDGADADSPDATDVPRLIAGDVVTWTYHVTNTGDVPLTSITLVDNIVGTVDNLVNQSINSDDILDVGEVWTFEAADSVVAGAYANSGTVSGNFEEFQVTDTDLSHYFGLQPTIDIEKFTNGFDADLAGDTDVPRLLVDELVTWTYRVTNNSDVPLQGVMVIDNQLGSITNIISRGTNDDDILDAGEFWVYEAVGTVLAGAYENVGTVTANALTTSNDEIAVQDSDASHYVGLVPSIQLEKSTNGVDADTPNQADVPQLAIGSGVTWTYAVTNTGEVPLGEIEVTDDQLGPVANIVSRSINTDDILDVGEVWVFEATGIVISGAYANLGTVTANAGFGSETQRFITSSDPSHYFGINSFVVTNTNDSGPGSLRQAMLNANATGGEQTITFEIPATDPGLVDIDSDAGGDVAGDIYLIELVSPLPTVNDVTGSITIDATTQVDFSGVDTNPAGPDVVIDGTQLGTAAAGFHLTSPGNVIRGFGIQRFSQAGILIDSADANLIAGNFIGIRADGVTPAGNSGCGVLIRNGNDNIIGTGGGGETNVISGNGDDGVCILGDNGDTASRNMVQGNLVGVSATGQLAVPNGGNGISVEGAAADNVIGSEGILAGDNPIIVLVVDVSGSVANTFEGVPTGDLNNDGSPNTVLDGEIQALISLNADLVNLGFGTSAQIAIVAFESTAMLLDMNPATPEVDLATQPSADMDGNGVLDVVQALQSLRDSGGTQYGAALQATLDTLSSLGATRDNGNVIFVSDGEPSDSGGFADEAQALRNQYDSVRAFGAGPMAGVESLRIIDPDAENFSDAESLSVAIRGTAAGGAGQYHLRQRKSWRTAHREWRNSDARARKFHRHQLLQRRLGQCRIGGLYRRRSQFVLVGRSESVLETRLPTMTTTVCRWLTRSRCKTRFAATQSTVMAI